MIFQLFRRTRDDPSITSLYGTIVAQARAPAFYQSFGVADTVNGRLEMIVLHVVMLLRRLAPEPAAGPSGQALDQAIFDLFCRDMDANLREMGVGDLAVPRTMRRIGEAFYGRQAAYKTALDSSDPRVLVDVLARNVLDGHLGANAERLAGYVRAAVRALAEQSIADLRQGKLGFPDPANLETTA